MSADRQKGKIMYKMTSLNALYRVTAKWVTTDNNIWGHSEGENGKYIYKNTEIK